MGDDMGELKKQMLAFTIYLLLVAVMAFLIYWLGDVPFLFKLLKWKNRPITSYWEVIFFLNKLLVKKHANSEWNLRRKNWIFSFLSTFRKDFDILVKRGVDPFWQHADGLAVCWSYHVSQLEKLQKNI